MPRPELQELHAGLDAVADAHRYDVLAPEVRNGVADELPFLVLEDRDAARLLGDDRRGREVGTVVQVEGRAVDHDGADVIRMHRLDGEAPHLGRDQLEVDVVGLGAQRRRAGVLHIDREIVGGKRGRREHQRRNKNANATHTHPRNSPPSAARRASGRWLRRSASHHARASGSRPTRHCSGVTQRGATLEARVRHITLNRGEFERERRHRLR